MITRDEITRMAREAGFQTGCLYPQNGKGEPTLLVCALGTSCTVEVEKLIRAAYAAGAAAVYKDENMFTEAYAGGYAAGAAAERERICNMGKDDRYSHQYVHSFLAAIRARSEK